MSTMTAITETKVTSEEEIPEPFLGRMVIKVTTVDAEAHLRQLYGMKDDSKLALPGELVKGKKPPVTKGIIIKMAPDCFGEAFTSRYGSDIPNLPKLGDEIVFVANDSYPLDLKGRFHLIADQDVVAYYKRTKEE